MKARFLIAAALALVLALPAAGWAKPRIELKVRAEKEVRTVRDGKTVVQKVVADKAAPGETIHYTIVYRNTGDEPATAVKVDNPIPRGTAYLAETAYGLGAAITFSVDGGKSFAPADKLMVKEKQADGSFVTRKARADEYTHIRWVIDSVPAGADGTVGFAVQVR